MQDCRVVLDIQDECLMHVLAGTSQEIGGHGTVYWVVGTKTGDYIMKYYTLLITLFLGFSIVACGKSKSTISQLTPDTILTADGQVAKATTILLPPASTPSAVTTWPIVRSTPTPTQFASHTPTLTITQSLAGDGESTDPTGRIYVWDPPVYGYLNPSDDIGFIHALSPDNGQRGPGEAESLAFSNYSGQIAYLIESDQDNFVLWVADLDLQQTASLWIDSENWLGISSVYDIVQMRWGPGDQSIFLETDKDENVKDEYYGILYSLKEHSAVRLSSRCNSIIFSPASENLALGCHSISGETQASFILEQDGSIEPVSDLPAGLNETVKDWAFAPDGSQAVLATDDDELKILNINGEQMEIPIGYKPPRSDIVMRVLQWSRNGDRLLIFGDAPNANVCPAGSVPNSPCWMVLSSQTTDIIWHADVIADFGASVSPDGKWVVLFCMDLPVRYGIVAQVDNNLTKIIYDEVVEAVYWDN